jgi:hypothetical protein
MVDVFPTFYLVVPEKSQLTDFIALFFILQLLKSPETVVLT